MIFLKRKIFSKGLFKSAFIIIFCGALLFGAAYAYLYYNFNKQTAKAEQKDYTVPYKNVPDNAGIAFLLPDSSGVVAYLDFENSCINVINIENYDTGNDLYYGYTVDFIVEADYQLIAGIADRVGGVNVETNGKTMRYTGVQILDLISVSSDANIKTQIIMQIFKQISENDFSKDDFVYIIENAESNLTVIDCIYWIEYIDEMSKNINFVNLENSIK